MEGDNHPFLGHIRKAFADWQSATPADASREHPGVEQLTQEMQARYQAVVAQIPDCISCHFSQGRSYGYVMRLRYDESDEDPRWETGHWDNNRPDPDKLQHAARQVYDFCLEHQLEPYLVRGYDFDIQKPFLYLGINCRHHL